MAKLRSYNEQFLIAASLIASVLNDVVIQRRKHLQNRDYSKPIQIKDILQKNIQVPCIFGDRSIILKSLQNHQGAIKLPLFVLQSNGIKSDEVRFADLHVDLLYQRDQQFTMLAKDNPLYYPYDLRRRRPLPITIDYQLTMLAKYKQDLDQMMTNWMVHCRPDLYVKWWHPRDKSKPLQSEILWSHNISYKKPEQQPTNKFQYQGTTQFTFKTWVFPGLDYLEDAYNNEDDGIIKYFNWFPTDVNTTEQDGTQGYPTLGSFGSTPAGLFAVPNNMEFENDGSDQKGIKLGKYYINNLTQTPSSLYNGDNGIKDIEATCDALTKDTYNRLPLWEEFQQYCKFDNITNERAGIKAVYFTGGFPLSAMLVPQNPSGDFLFQHFCQIGNSKLDKISGFYGSLEEDGFGICFTESLIPIIDYNFQNKTFIVTAHMENFRYGMGLSSFMSSQKGILQAIEIYNIPSTIFNRNLKIKLIRQTDTQFNILHNIKDQTRNITILNNSGFKNNHDPIMFRIETSSQQKKCRQTLQLIKQFWDYLEIYPSTNTGERVEENTKFQHYKLDSTNTKFKTQIKKLYTYEDFSMFLIRKEFIKNNIEYTVIANNYLYFVLSDEGIYDYGCVNLPKFHYGYYPIFQSQYKDGPLIYGIGMDCKLASVIK